MMPATWITATPPTPNGPLHLGHIAGPYLAADVLRRALAASGRRVKLTTGLDDNQSYVSRRAREAGVSPESLAAEYSDSIMSTWKRVGVEFDTVVRPHGDEYEERVQTMFDALVDRGAILPQQTALPYCADCELWLYEAHLVGACPHCGASTNGNACEQCCRPNACIDVLDAICIHCGEQPEIRDIELLVLRLELVRDELIEYWSQVDMPQRLRAICETMLEDGLPDILAAHPSDWGIPVPTSGFSHHRIYVWLEMAEGYSAERVASAPDDGSLVQFFGIDNGYFHAVLFPAVNLLLQRPLLLADKFVVNEFFLLNGKKFSTSRQHAVWAETFVATSGRDLLRFHCCLHRPDTRQSNFTLQSLAESEAILERWEDLFRRVLEIVSGVRAETTGPMSPELASLREWVSIEAAGVDHALSLEGFDPARAAAALVQTAEAIRRLLDEVSSIRAEDDRRQVALASLKQAAALFASVSAPVTPDGAERLQRSLVTFDRPGTKFFGFGI